ncbi:MAG: M15 family peptidase [Cytophagia bacterium]|nr:M15 family peptidase [Cytophagia bacterium]
MPVKICLFFMLSFCSFAVYGVQETDSLQLNCQKQLVKSVNFQDLQWMFRERVRVESQDQIPTHLDFFIENASGLKSQNYSFDVASENKENLFALSNMTDDLLLVWGNTLAHEIENFNVLKDSLANVFNPRGYRLKFLQSERGLARQMDLFNRGRSMTALSMHNFNLAVDVGIYRRGRYLRRSNRYEILGRLAKNLGAFWGGDFVGFPDVGHIQAFSNGANLVQKFPELTFEYIRYKYLYEQNYASALARGQGDLVEDTRQLIMELNKNRAQKVCACQQAITIPKDLTAQWFEQFRGVSTGYVYVNQQAGWVYIKNGDSGYFYPLGIYSFATKN